jgi:ABC-type transporter MlaC component|tara:strand:+ start:492 stop:1136 length:645 start_codon:yes stop_codon:yes gene_type:complete
MNIFVALLVITALTPGNANAQTDPREQLRTQFVAYQLVQRFQPGAIEKIKSQVTGAKKTPRAVAKFMKRHFDWETHAELCFQDWNELNPAQKKTFTELLKKSTIVRYSRLLSAKKKYVVEFPTPTRYQKIRGEDYARVATRLVTPDNNSMFDVVFLLREKGSRWVLCDIEVEGVSKARIYRSAFKKVFAKRGIDGVVDILRRSITKHSLQKDKR